MDLAECKPFFPVFLFLFAERVLTQTGSLICSTAQLHMTAYATPQEQVNVGASDLKGACWAFIL